jgi:hypothetical protein
MNIKHYDFSKVTKDTILLEHKSNSRKNIRLDKLSNIEIARVFEYIAVNNLIAPTIVIDRIQEILNENLQYTYKS